MPLENIWVKRGADISAFGFPLFVMATAMVNQRHWRGEYYILLGGRYPAFLHSTFTVTIGSIPDDIVTVDAHFMQMELEQQVTTRLSIHCFDLYEKSTREGFLAPLRLADGEAADILRAWLRGEFHESISQMCSLTRIDDLGAYLSDVVRLTPIVSK